MLKPGAVSSRREFTRIFILTLIILHSSPTIIDPKPCALGVLLWPQRSLTPMNATYGGTPCHNTTTTMCKLVVHPDPLHSPTAASSVNNYNPDTRSGTAQHVGTATIAGDTITLAKTATTPTPSASLSQSVWFLLLIATHCLGWHTGAPQPISTHAITPTTGVTTARTPRTTTTTGRLDAWKHHARGGVMS